MMTWCHDSNTNKPLGAVALLLVGVVGGKLSNPKT